MPKETKQTPNDDVLARLMHQALLHALRNADEVDNALERGKWPLAFTLAERAFEEVGKAALCLAALVTPEDERTAMPFVQMVNSHTPKIVLASLLSALFGESVPALPLERLMDDLMSDAKRIHGTRMRGMYVDYAENGTVTLPEDEVDEEEARAMAAKLRAALMAVPPVVSQPHFDYAEFVAFVRLARAIVAGTTEPASTLIPAQARAEIESWFANELVAPFGGVGLPDLDSNPDGAVVLLHSIMTYVRHESNWEHVPVESTPTATE